MLVGCPSTDGSLEKPFETDVDFDTFHIQTLCKTLGDQ